MGQDWRETQTPRLSFPREAILPKLAATLPSHPGVRLLMNGRDNDITRAPDVARQASPAQRAYQTRIFDDHHEVFGRGPTPAASQDAAKRKWVAESPTDNMLPTEDR